MSKFKVGDRVVLSDEAKVLYNAHTNEFGEINIYGIKPGKKATITDVIGDLVYVKEDTRSNAGWHIDYFKLADKKKLSLKDMLKEEG